ncbi:hypothetical protein ACA910_004483 [Epithemia clementina (nom. ined.)]
MESLPPNGWKVNRALCQPSLTLTDEFLSECLERCKKWATNIHLHYNDAFQGVTRTSRGSGKHTNTLKEYHDKYRELFKFSCILGDWRSACLFGRFDDGSMRVCPSNPWPASPETITKYLYWKIGEVGTPLQYNNYNVCDVYGKALTCVGQWSDPGNVDKVFSAVGALHRMYSDLKVNEYTELCTECVCLNAASLNNSNAEAGSVWKSCASHQGSPRVRPLGNPNYSRVLISAKAECKKSLSTQHIRKGNIRLLPGDIRNIRNYLWTPGKPYGIMLYTMILVGMSLFLRSDELLSINTAHFEQRGTIVVEGLISSLVLFIQGKNDPRPIYMKLFRNDKCPEFCPVRHLLFYIEMLSLTAPDGFLFFDKKTINKLFSGKITHNKDLKGLKYPAMLDEIKRVIAHCCPTIYNNEFSIIGTHTIRKLAYLLAIWGVLSHLAQSELEATKQTTTKNGEATLNLPPVILSDITLAARHKDVMTASFYIQNVTMLFWSVREQGDVLSAHRVSVWKNNYIGPYIASYFTITASSHKHQLPLFKLAQKFVNDEMGLPLMESNRVERSAMCFGDIDHKLTGLLSVKTMADGKEGMLAKLLGACGMEDKKMQQILDIVNGIKSDAIEEGQAICKRKLEADATKVTSKRQRCDDNDENAAICVTDKNAAICVTPDKTPTQTATEAATMSTTARQLTRDLKHWRQEWKDLTDGKNEADLKKIWLFLDALKKIDTTKKNIKLDNSGRCWRNRVLKFLPRFKKCIDVCCEGDEEKFYKSEHAGKFVDPTLCLCNKSRSTEGASEGGTL